MTTKRKPIAATIDRDIFPSADDVLEAERSNARRSNRKPHSGNVGYVCELKNRRTGIGHVVIYDKQLGFDADTDARYVIVCETHHTMTSAAAMPAARAIMKAVDFCEECS